MADWFRNAIVYQILIDRFAGLATQDWNKPRFLGGNLRGITDRLDYITDLGVDTVWLSPLYKTSEYHGYAVTDYFQVEPHFGTLDDLQALIAKLHQAGLRVIADFVPNHCSQHHPYFREAQKDRTSPYVDWFYFMKWPSEYLCFLDVQGLPKLNLDHPETGDHIIKAAKYWLSQGFDGFRLDHVIGPTHRFWQRFRKEIRAEYPQALLLGEAWLAGVRYKHIRTIAIRSKHSRWRSGLTQDDVQQEYYRELDGVLDFGFSNLIRDHLNSGKWTDGPKGLEKELRHHFAAYPSDYYLAIFLDNHDMNRFLFECDNSIDKLFAAARLQFQFEQPVIIYYGTEVGMTHSRSVWEKRPNADLEARRPMIWDNQDKKILNFYKELINQRKKRKSRKKQKPRGVRIGASRPKPSSF